MLNLKKILLRWPKKIFSDAHALIVATVLAPFVAAGSIYLFAENLWIQLKISILLQIPLWATIVVAFLSGLLVYVIQRRVHSYDYKKNKDFSVIIDNIKWRTFWIAGDGYRLGGTPFCNKHDQQMKEEHDKFVCIGDNAKGCDTSITTREADNMYKNAVIICEKKLRGHGKYLA